MLSLAQLNLVVQEAWLSVTTEALRLNVLIVEPAHLTIVEFEPLLMLGFDEGVIMTCFSCTVMHYNSGKFVLVLVDGSVLLFRLSYIRGKIDLHREFESSIDLFVDEGIHIEHDTLEVDDDEVRAVADESSFGHICLFITELAVVVINSLPLTDLLQRVREGLGVFDIDL